MKKIDSAGQAHMEVMKKMDSTHSIDSVQASSPRVALYGGAFSPPHLGHASLIEAILRLFPCDEIWIISTRPQGYRKGRLKLFEKIPQKT